MPLTYSLTNEVDCQGIPFRNLNWSFQILENQTDNLVSFEQVEGDADLEIVCINRDKVERIWSELKEELKTCQDVSFNYEKWSLDVFDEGILEPSVDILVSVRSIDRSIASTTFEVCSLKAEDVEELGVYKDYLFNYVLEESTLGEAFSNSIGNKIIDAKVHLYDEDNRWKSCRDFPVREMHELLHTFRVAHVKELDWDPYHGPVIETKEDVDRFNDIMYPTYTCNNKKGLQEKYIPCLKYIYSKGEVGEGCENVNFLDESYDVYECEEGWYPIEGTDYCCQEPGMEIVDGFCV